MTWCDRAHWYRDSRQRPAYCDHQENRESVNVDHLRVPSGEPLPAAGLSAASGLYTSQRAEVAITQPQGETELSGVRRVGAEQT